MRALLVVKLRKAATIPIAYCVNTKSTNGQTNIRIDLEEFLTGHLFFQKRRNWQTLAMDNTKITRPSASISGKRRI